VNLHLLHGSLLWLLLQVQGCCHSVEFSWHHLWYVLSG
jgi:hypothetical protein